MKKLLFYIFIPVLAILLMSHNVSATNTNVVPGRVDVYYSTPGQTPISTITLSNLYVPPNFTEMKAWKIGENFNINMVCYYLGRSVTKNSIFAFSFSSLNTTVGVIGGGPNIKPHSVSVIHEASENTTNVHATSYFVTGHLNADVDQLCIGDAGSVNSVVLYDDGRLNTDMYILQPKINFYDERDQSADALNETKQETQDAANASETAGGSSSSSSQGATSNLLSVFTGFANVITNASATNCVINAPLNTTFGNDVFNVDLCGLSLPPAIGALTSIIAVMVVVPFAVSMFNKFIGIMESFQK